jgi:hypothetical protein
MSIQAGLLIAVVIGLFCGGFYFGTLHGKAQLEALQASQFQAMADAYRKQKDAAAASVAALEKENAELTADRLAYPDVAVRVCRIQAIGVPAATNPGHVVPAGAGVLSQVAAPAPDGGRDFGPDLFHLADEADQLIAHCRAQ